jgi:hypothetical protein
MHVGGDGNVVEPDDGDVVRHSATLALCFGDRGDRHQIVGEQHRRRPVSFVHRKQVRHRRCSAVSAEVTVELELLVMRQPAPLECRSPRIAAVAGVEEVVGATDERHPLMTEVSEVVDRSGHPGRVVEHHGWADAGSIGASQRDRGKSQCRESARARVVDA